MNNLIQAILDAIKSTILGKLIEELTGDLSARDVQFFILGALVALAAVEIGTEMNKPIVFIHIDKCGGMSVQDYLARQYSQDEICPVRFPVVSAQAIYPTISHVDVDLFKLNQGFVYDPQYRLIMGNYDTAIFDKIPEPKISLIVLREPVERAISLYQYVKRELDVFEQLTHDANQLGLDGWVRKYVGLWENAMTRQLAGVRWSSEAWLPVDEALYRQAVKQLKVIDYIGILPRLDVMLSNLADEMGWMRPEPTRLNVSVRQVDVSAETRSFIGSHCIWDSELYKVAEGIAE